MNYESFLVWKRIILLSLLVIVGITTLILYACKYEFFKRLKGLLYKSPSSEKAAEPVDTTILKDSLYHYQEFKRDKSLVNWIHSYFTLYKENECVELNELKQHLEDAKYRANRLYRPDIATVIFNFENDLIELEYDSNGILPKDRLNTLIADLEFNLNIQLYKPDQFLNRIKQTFPNFLDVAKSSPLYQPSRHETLAFAVFIVESFHQRKRVQLQRAFELIESILTEQQTLAKRALIIDFLIELIRLADAGVFHYLPSYIQPQTKIIFDNLREDWYYKYDEENYD
ncbi:hypothetical protein [Candidatus Bodocaedibacter vickermanii]|uniref:Uncharacterized protein n=1 Tax=Candidatus Bodocaedibacter vickermanii TaxID=2741701 RepID=A0A7L9RT41_9PROT|nr:hypothetical protein CPBP_00300 [Candidatus Paracaedibacteraceae bacterium 'Lake Konstanz']